MYVSTKAWFVLTCEIKKGGERKADKLKLWERKIMHCSYSDHDRSLSSSGIGYPWIRYCPLHPSQVQSMANLVQRLFPRKQAMYREMSAKGELNMILMWPVCPEHHLSLHIQIWLWKYLRIYKFVLILFSFLNTTQVEAVQVRSVFLSQLSTVTLGFGDSF